MLRAYCAWHFLTFQAPRELLLPEIILKCCGGFFILLDIIKLLFLLKIDFDNVCGVPTNTREREKGKVESCPMELPSRGPSHRHLGEHGQKEGESVVEGELRN